MSHNKITLFLFATILVSCTTPQEVLQQTPTETISTDIPFITTSTQTPSSTSTPQPHSLPQIFGPDDFPSNINPLTGREVAEPKAKNLLGALQRQEEAHYSLLSSIIEYYETPNLWMEQAEFHNIKDY